MSNPPTNPVIISFTSDLLDNIERFHRDKDTYDIMTHDIYREHIMHLFRLCSNEFQRAYPLKDNDDVIQKLPD
jgi:hypothetical protein